MRYRFGACELRIDSHELLVDGKPRDVEPQVFDLLRHLIEHSGKLVSQDDLIASVWNGRIVSDSAISARISAARAAVGDDGTRQRTIKTVPRRGFRFVADVQLLDRHQAPTTARGAEPAHQKVRRSDFAVRPTGPPSPTPRRARDTRWCERDTG